MSTAQKVIAAVTGAAGLGYGAYYMTQIKEVSQYDKDLRDIKQLIDSETKRIANNKKLTQEFELKVADLTKQGQEKAKAISDTELKLDAAQKQVQQLEGLLKAKRDDARKVAEGLKAAHDKLADLESETARAKESVTVSEKSLSLATQKLDSAKLLLNPLNHPRVKSLVGSK